MGIWASLYEWRYLSDEKDGNIIGIIAIVELALVPLPNFYDLTHRTSACGDFIVYFKIFDGNCCFIECGLNLKRAKELFNSATPLTWEQSSDWLFGEKDLDEFKIFIDEQNDDIEDRWIKVGPPQDKISLLGKNLCFWQEVGLKFGDLYSLLYASRVEAENLLEELIKEMKLIDFYGHRIFSDDVNFSRDDMALNNWIDYPDIYNKYLEFFGLVSRCQGLMREIRNKNKVKRG